MNKQEIIELLNSEEGRKEIKKNQDKVLEVVSEVWENHPTTTLSQLIYEGTSKDCNNNEFVCQLKNYDNEQRGDSLRQWPLSEDTQLSINRIINNRIMEDKDYTIRILKISNIILCLSCAVLSFSLFWG